jgi:hypothetical protein
MQRIRKMQRPPPRPKTPMSPEARLMDQIRKNHPPAMKSKMTS